MECGNTVVEGFVGVAFLNLVIAIATCDNEVIEEDLEGEGEVGG